MASGFDRKWFVKTSKTFVALALFIFALAAINLVAKTNDQLISTVAMEPAGYVGMLNAHYDGNEAQNKETIKQVISELENDKQSKVEKHIYVLDKGDSSVIATGEVNSRIQEELNAQVNEKLIVIDNQSCKVIDFDHYRVLVQVNTLAAYQQFMDALFECFLFTLLILAVALALLAVCHRFAAGNKRRVSALSMVLMLAISAAFAFNTLGAELSQLDLVVNEEKAELQADLNYMCNDGALANYDDAASINELGGFLAKASTTLKEVEYVGPKSHLGATSGTNKFDAAQDVKIVQDDEAIEKERTNFYIQAALLILLAFILMRETSKKARALEEAQARVAAAVQGAASKAEAVQGQAVVAAENATGKAAAAQGAASKTAPGRAARVAASSGLTPTDECMRTVMLLVGFAGSCFNVINVLRIRQVVMLYWTDDVSMVINAIFTVATLATVLGSLMSSALLRRCSNVKTYVMVTCVVGLVGAVMCGISNNFFLFFGGLIIFNAARVTSRMAGEFYTTLIKDEVRKDRCYIELDSNRSLGQVVGNIVGGIVSVVVSFAFVQIFVGVIFAVTILYVLRMDGSQTVVRAEREGEAGADEAREGEEACAADAPAAAADAPAAAAGKPVKKQRRKSDLADVVAILKNGQAVLYIVCIAIVCSIPYMLIQYKLPLDIATLGLSAVVLSFMKTIYNTIQAYATVLYRRITKYVKGINLVTIYLVLSGLVVLLYMMNGSLVAMLAAVMILGLLNGAASYSVMKTFIDLPAIASSHEPDRHVALKIGQKVGDTISPTLLSVFQSGPVLPIIVMVLPVLYWLKQRFAKNPAQPAARETSEAAQVEATKLDKR